MNVKIKRFGKQGKHWGYYVETPDVFHCAEGLRFWVEGFKVKNHYVLKCDSGYLPSNHPGAKYNEEGIFGVEPVNEEGLRSADSILHSLVLELASGHADQFDLTLYDGRKKVRKTKNKSPLEITS